MPLDVLEPSLVGRANGVSGAAPRLRAQELNFDLVVKVLQRDDPQRKMRAGNPFTVLFDSECRLVAHIPRSRLCTSSAAIGGSSDVRASLPDR